MAKEARSPLNCANMAPAAIWLLRSSNHPSGCYSATGKPLLLKPSLHSVGKLAALEDAEKHLIYGLGGRRSAECLATCGGLTETLDAAAPHPYQRPHLSSHKLRLLLQSYVSAGLAWRRIADPYGAMLRGVFNHRTAASECHGCPRKPFKTESSEKLNREPSTLHKP